MSEPLKDLDLILTLVKSVKRIISGPNSPFVRRSACSYDSELDLRQEESFADSESGVPHEESASEFDVSADNGVLNSTANRFPEFRFHVEGSELNRVVSSTTLRKTGQHLSWLTMPPQRFATFTAMTQHFKSQGWRVKKANKKGAKGQKYVNFYCRHGGDSAKYHRQQQASGCIRKQNHRSFGDPATAPFCCPARLNCTYYPNCEAVCKITNEGHNHSPDRNLFSLPVARLDHSMTVLDIIIRDARENPILRASDLFVYFMRSIDLDFIGEKRSEFKDIFGILKRDMMKEVTELVRRARQEDKRLDLEFLVQAYLRDTSISGEHEPRIIGLSYDYDITVLTKLCIVISTSTLLRRATRGHNQALLIDGTHQTNTAGYKVITFGTEDCFRRYHLIALAITTEESIYEISAGIESIRKSIRELPQLDAYSAETEWRPQVVMADGPSAITGAILKCFPSARERNRVEWRNESN